MPEPAVQQALTIIEIRLYRNGWQCFEAPGVQPYWTGPDAGQSAIDYAKARAKFGRGEIRVLSIEGDVENVMSLQGMKSPDGFCISRGCRHLPRVRSRLSKNSSTR